MRSKMLLYERIHKGIACTYISLLSVHRMGTVSFQEFDTAGFVDGHCAILIASVICLGRPGASHCCFVFSSMLSTDVCTRPKYLSSRMCQTYTALYLGL